MSYTPQNKQIGAFCDFDPVFSGISVTLLLDKFTLVNKLIKPLLP
jgi:hypothetical protein